MFYDYANYYRLSPDLQMLWWFDEYLCHDLIYYSRIINDGFIDTSYKPIVGHGTVVVLVQRYNLYGLKYDYADDYSYYLWQLLYTTDIVSNQWISVNPPNTTLQLTLSTATCDFTIPATETAEEVVITYYTPDFNHRAVIERVTPYQVSYRIARHQRFIRTRSQPTPVTIPAVMPYSIVINCDNATVRQVVTQAVPSQFRYSNIADWIDNYDSYDYGEPLTVTRSGEYVAGGIRYVEGGEYVYEPNLTPPNINIVGDWSHDPTQQPLYFAVGNTTEFPVTVTAIPSPSSDTDFYHAKLIYADPTDLFGGLFNHLIGNRQTLDSGNLRYDSTPHQFINHLFMSPPPNIYRYIRTRAVTAISGADVFGRFHYYYEEVFTVTIDYDGFWQVPADMVDVRQPNSGYTDRFATLTYPYSVTMAIAELRLLLAQTAIIRKSGVSNLKEILRVNSQGQPIDWQGNVTYDPDFLEYDDNPDYVEEYVMGLELMVQEIHACLGAGEFSYYTNAEGNLQPYYMSMARLLTRFSRAYGVAFNPDGSIIATPPRRTREYNANNQVTIPDGYTRGQFDDFPEEPSASDLPVMPPDTVGISYQNRCNKYLNFNDRDPDNNIMRRGDVVLCHNFIQYIESFLEDLDKGLNWQEMGTGLLPSADGTGYCTFEGLGTLLAEVAYMLSSLSNNIYQTQNLSLQTQAVVKEIFKGLGLPVKLGSIKIDTGDIDFTGDPIIADLPVPYLADDAVTIHRRLLDVIANIALILNGNNLNVTEPEEEEE